MEEFGTYIDPRDGKTYKTVKIYEQTWLAENLNYECEASKVYYNDPEYADIYGRLYNWETALKVCPPGWHLPSNDEWDELMRSAGGIYDEFGAGSPYNGKIAGILLKAKDGWDDDGGGDDVYGFSALPGGGSSNGRFYKVGSDGAWWSANEYDKHRAHMRRMSCDERRTACLYLVKLDLISIRCIKD